MIPKVHSLYAVALLACSALLSLPAEAMGEGKEIVAPGVKDDPNAISPPWIVEPIYGCARAVRVRGFIPGAKVYVYVDGVQVASVTGENDQAGGMLVNVPGLVPGQVVTAEQEWNGVVSPMSDEAVVRDHTKEFPYGLPMSRIFPAPVYECGLATTSRYHVPGSWVEFFSQPHPGAGSYTLIADRPTTLDWSEVRLSSPFVLGEAITTQYSLCGDTSPMSVEVEVLPEPSTLPVPAVGTLYAGQTEFHLTDVVQGAVVTVFVNGNPVHQAPSGYNGEHVVLPSPLNAGDKVIAMQSLCSDGPKGPDVEVRDCAELPAPRIATPQIGDRWVTVTDSVPGARIRIYDASLQEIGDGSGERVYLYRPVRPGDVLLVVQEVGNCEGSIGWLVEAECIVPDLVPDDSTHGPYDVGKADYLLPTPVTIGSDTVRIMATVRYPLNASGTAPAPGKHPLVLFLHGNHGTVRVSTPSGPVDVCGGTGTEAPSWHGYDYALEALARNGYIAVSINANDLNCKPDRIPERATLILVHIELWHWLNSVPSEYVFNGYFTGFVDVERIGVVGHSRGGEAAVAAAAGSTELIDAVISLAPVDFHGHKLEKTPLLMILPSADGDVIGNDGAKIYDRSELLSADLWKSQFYVYGADHNRFNREWLESDGAWWGFPDLLTRADQERMLQAWSLLFFDHWLRGRTANRAAFSGEAIVDGLPNEKIFPSFETSDSFLVDDHEDGVVGVNTVGGGVTNYGFFLFDEYPFMQVAGAYNASFFHETDGLIAAWRKDPSAELFSETSGADYDFVSFRVTQVNDPLNATGDAMAMRVGIDAGGTRYDAVTPRIIPFPYDTSPLVSKSMMRTIRVPMACFGDKKGPVDPKNVKGIWLGPIDRDDGVLGIDQLAFSN